MAWRRFPVRGGRAWPWLLSWYKQVKNDERAPLNAGVFRLVAFSSTCR